MLYKAKIYKRFKCDITGIVVDFYTDAKNFDEAVLKINNYIETKYSKDDNIVLESVNRVDGVLV